MADSIRRQWKIRKVIRRPGMHINVAADTNVVATEGGSASGVQRTRIVQGGQAQASESDEKHEE
jgi:hypothetical protein